MVVRRDPSDLTRLMARRWFVVLGAILVQMCLGSIFAWGAYTSALQSPDGAFRFSHAQTQGIYSAALVAFAVTMTVAGRLQDRYGPRRIALIGGLLLSLGYIGAGLAGTTYLPMLLLIGVVGGIGIGMGYVCPIAACVKWFPDMKGLVTGLAVAGFGLGSFFLLQLAGPAFGLVQRFGVNGVFLIFGIAFFFCTLTGGSLLSNPPANWIPAGMPAQTYRDGRTVSRVREMNQFEILGTLQFWMIWFAFMYSAGCGLMVIGNLRDFALLECRHSEVVATWIIGALAIFNGAGRVVWGVIAQRMTPRKAMVLMCLLQAPIIFAITRLGTSAPWLFVAACCAGFNFGANFTLFPLLTLENFGSKHLGQNYGAVYTSYGAGGILGPLMAGYIWDVNHSYALAFTVASLACLAAGLTLFFKKPMPSHPDFSDSQLLMTDHDPILK